MMEKNIRNQRIKIPQNQLSHLRGDMMTSKMQTCAIYITAYLLPAFFRFGSNISETFHIKVTFLTQKSAFYRTLLLGLHLKRLQMKTQREQKMLVSEKCLSKNQIRAFEFSILAAQLKPKLQIKTVQLRIQLAL